MANLMKQSTNILIISDTHGNYPIAIKATDLAAPIDYIVHLGDGLEDAQLVEECTGLPVVKVPGNCDFPSYMPKDVTVIFSDKKILLTHGHTYSVKSGLHRLYEKAVAEGTAIVLYGHTHAASIEKFNGILFINPGCLAPNSVKMTCAILSIKKNGNCCARIVQLD